MTTTALSCPAPSSAPVPKPRLHFEAGFGGFLEAPECLPANRPAGRNFPGLVIATLTSNSERLPMRIFLTAVTTSLALPLLVLADESPRSIPIGEKEEDPNFLNRRGTEHFFAGRIKQSLEDWDRVVDLVPQRAPHHWQRGIALYYAGRYQDGVAQFESHQTVNGTDVENAVWHFICAVRTKNGSVQKAREKMYPFAGDRRVPLREVHDLFKGTGSEQKVLAAANEDKSDKLRHRNHLCYAHLYLGLYYEAVGKDEKARRHMRMAAVDYKMDHYMGRVAQIHHSLRSTQKKDVPQKNTAAD